jgi:hypothetical protein
MSADPRRPRRNAILAAFTFALAVSVALPSLAFGGPIGDVVNSIGLGGGSGSGSGSASGGGSGSAAPAPATAGARDGYPGVGSGYQPPLHGSNPHGQGTVATVDVTPPAGSQLPGDGEEIVVGDSRGEQNADGSYHGKVTVLRLNLFGLIDEQIAFETGPGETNNGPVAPIQTALDAICSGSGSNLCLTLLAINSTTSSSGSQNSFQLVGADLGNGALQLGAAESSGNISESGGCQTATGTSSVADADGFGGVLTADVLQGSTSSTACNDGTQSQSNNSTVVNLLGFGVPLPVPGCATGTPDAEFTALAPILATVCNADDTNGVGEALVQAGAPYGVREALVVFLLGDLVKVTLSGPESHAVAPPVDDTPDTPGSGDTAGQVGGGGEEAGLGGDPVSETSQPLGGDTLPFTGAMLAALVLIGAALLAAGAGFGALQKRRRLSL